MSDNDLRTAVREQLSTVVAVTLTPDHDEINLAEIAPERYDSLGVLDCVGLIEREFGVSIDIVEDDLRTTFRSVSSIAALVARKQHDAAILGVM